MFMSYLELTGNSCFRYAKKMGYPHLENVALPRMGAIETIFESLNAQPVKGKVKVQVVKTMEDKSLVVLFTCLAYDQLTAVLCMKQ